MAGSDNAFLGAKIGAIIDLTGVGTVRAEFIDFLSKQHFISPRIYYNAYSA